MSVHDRADAHLSPAARLERYRQAARRKYGKVGSIEVSPHGSVLPLPDGGAFVEVYVWVEESDVEPADHQ